MPKQRGHAVWISDDKLYDALRKMAFEWSMRDGRSWDVAHVVIKLIKDTIKYDEHDL